jgi:hypothetical protein
MIQSFYFVKYIIAENKDRARQSRAGNAIALISNSRPQSPAQASLE